MTRTASGAAVAAGLVWVAVSVHGLSAHGTTTVNEQELVLGLTWMDSAKLLVVPPLLFVAVVVALFRRLPRPGVVTRGATVVVVAALVAMAVGTALQFWPFPWGTYAGEAERFDDALPSLGGAVQALASVVLTLALAAFAWALGRARAVPWWLAVALVASAPPTVFLTPPLPVTGLLWLAVGVALARAWAAPRAGGVGPAT